MSITGTGPRQLSVVLLDFIYGVAAFLHWGQQEINDMMEHHFNIHYQSILASEQRSENILQEMDSLLEFSMLIKDIVDMEH